MTKLRLPLSINLSSGFFPDTSDIQTQTQYAIISALYGTLFEIDNSGQIRPGFAETYVWKNNVLTIKLRELVSSMGEVLDAKDVVASFNRLIEKDSNTHGKLVSFLGKNPILGNKREVVFTLIDKNKRHFFIELLASADFSIIPKSAISSRENNFKITNYRNSSGPYYFEKFENGIVTLKINKNNFHFSKDMPTSIELLNISKKEALEKIVTGDIDIIGNQSALMLADVKKIKEIDQDLTVIETEPIQLVSLIFLAPGLRRFTVEERSMIAAEVKKAVYSSKIHPDLEASSEIYPPNGANGSLTDDQIQKLNFFLSQTKKLNKKIEIKMSPRFAEGWKSELIFPKEISISTMTKYPVNLPESEQPDAIIVYSDSAFYEDISYLSYKTSSKMFGLDTDSGHKWISHYMTIEDKAERMDKLKEYHLEILLRGVSYPLGYLRCYSVVRSPWKINAPKYYVGTRLWKISRNE